MNKVLTEGKESNSSLLPAGTKPSQIKAVVAGVLSTSSNTIQSIAKVTLSKTKFVAAAVGMATLCITTVAAIAAAVWFYTKYSASASGAAYNQTTKDDLEHNNSFTPITESNRGLGSGDIAAIVLGSFFGVVLIGVAGFCVFMTRAFKMGVDSSGLDSIHASQENLKTLTRCCEKLFDQPAPQISTAGLLPFGCNSCREKLQYFRTNAHTQFHEGQDLNIYDESNLAGAEILAKYPDSFVLVRPYLNGFPEKIIEYILIKDKNSYSQLCFMCKSCCCQFALTMNNYLPLTRAKLMQKDSKNPTVDDV
jgi:hypothetical protein